MHNLQHRRPFARAVAGLSGENRHRIQFTCCLGIGQIIRAIREHAHLHSSARSAKDSARQRCPMRGVPLRIHGACSCVSFLRAPDETNIGGAREGFHLAEGHRCPNGAEFGKAVHHHAPALLNQRQQPRGHIRLYIHEHAPVRLQGHVCLDVFRFRREGLAAIAFHRMNQLRFHLRLRRCPGGLFVQQGADFLQTVLSHSGRRSGERAQATKKQRGCARQRKEKSRLNYFHESAREKIEVPGSWTPAAIESTAAW